MRAHDTTQYGAKCIAIEDRIVGEMLSIRWYVVNSN